MEKLQNISEGGRKCTRYAVDRIRYKDGRGVTWQADEGRTSTWYEFRDVSFN